MFYEQQYGIMQAVQAFSNPALDIFFQIINMLGHPVFWFIVAAFFYWKGKERTTFHIVNLLLFTSVVVGAMKLSVNAPRPSPSIVERKIEDISNELSFPSGHSATAAAIYAHYSGILKNNWKWIALLLVILVALARVYLGVHFPIDVIVGLALGFAIGKMNLFIERKFEKAHFRLTKLEDDILIVAAIVVFLAGLYLISSITLLALLMGFYAGFFAWQERKVKQKKFHGVSLAVKAVIGYVIFAAIVVPAAINPAIGSGISFALYFIAGIWVSFIYPWLAEKFSF